MSLRIILSSYIAISLVLAKRHGRNRIVGGEMTEIEKHPYMVNIMKDDLPFCAGSVISDNTVLTAAHCLVDESPEDLRVVVGDTYSSGHYGQRFKVNSMKHHRKFRMDYPVGYDVGLMRICGAFRFGPGVQPITLSSAAEIPPGIDATIAGWGKEDVWSAEWSGRRSARHGSPLRVAHVPIIDDAACQRAHSMFEITATMLCAWSVHEDRDACHGDSGGPLVIGSQQVGIVSFGIGCGSNYPGVYTRVSAVLDWIHRNMHKLE